MLPTMAHAQFLTLFALIQYGSAEIASNSPGGSWFAANVISDSDAPKPLTEIFTTERAFLSTNPIVVLPSSTASAFVDTTTTSMGTQEISTQSTVSAPPTSDNPAPISTSTISTTVTQTPAQTDNAAPVQTGPPASSGSPSPQNSSQPQQNFFYIYPQGPVGPQPQAQFQTASTTVAPCVTATSASPQTATALTPTTTVRSVPMTTTQNTTRPLPTIRIRMLSPSGSITNINFVRGSTTARPITSTRRNRRRNRNNYDDCVDTCVGRRTPICASIAGRSISGDTLKGFPTMCHMACNNSFRKNAYEKVADGRCGRLRRRIMNMNQPSRNQFTILANPGSFVEFQPGLITTNNI